MQCEPVKLNRPKNNLMKKHEDGHFASATVKGLNNDDPDLAIFEN